MAGDQLRLTVLGSATPYPSVDNPCSGYLVESGDTRLWMDAGTGTLAALQRYTRLDGLSAIWVSHLHADHSADLLTAYYGALFADVRLAAPIPLFAPPGTADRLAHFLTNSPVRSPIESAYDIRELHDGYRVRVGRLSLFSRAVAHGMPAFGVRVEAAGHRLAYSGDSAPCPSLIDLASGCDALLCEAGDDERPDNDERPDGDKRPDNDEPPDGDEPPGGDEPVHHTPEQAGETARAARVSRLIVTHVGRAIDPERAVTRAATRFAGPIDYAAPGATFTIA